VSNEDMLSCGPGPFLPTSDLLRIEPASIDDISHRARTNAEGSQAHGPTSGYDKPASDVFQIGCEPARGPRAKSWSWVDILRCSASGKHLSAVV